MIVTVNARSDADPCPRVEVEATGITGGVITVERIVDGGATAVRGALDAPVSTGFLVVDYELPFTTDVTYRVTDGAGSVTTERVIVYPPSMDRYDLIWIQDPLKPESARNVMVERDSLASWSMSRELNLLGVRGSSLPIASGGAMSGRQQVPLRLISESEQETADLIGFFSEATVFLARTVDSLPMPRAAYFTLESIGFAPERADMEQDPDERWTYLEMSLTQVRAPAASVVVPVFTWRDVIDNYTSWADLIATKATWADVIRDPRP